jgi:hypothetical protein
MNTSSDLIKSAHIHPTYHARNYRSKQQKTGTHTYLRRYVNMKIELYYGIREYKHIERFGTTGRTY